MHILHCDVLSIHYFGITDNELCLPPTIIMSPVFNCFKSIHSNPTAIFVPLMLFMICMYKYIVDPATRFSNMLAYIIKLNRICNPKKEEIKLVINP